MLYNLHSKMWIINICFVVIFIKYVSSIGTIPFVCDVNSKFINMKIPTIKECDDTKMIHTNITASLWVAANETVDSILFRSILMKCENPSQYTKKINILHMYDTMDNYVSDNTFKFFNFETYKSLNKHIRSINLKRSIDNFTNTWLRNDCFDNKNSLNPTYQEIKRFKHVFLANNSYVLSTRLDNTKIGSIIYKKCKDQLKFISGVCKYTMDDKYKYIYVWDTSKYKKKIESIFLPDVKYNNIYPYELYDYTTSVDIYKNYIGIPKLNLYFNSTIGNNEPITSLGNGYFITYPINNKTTCKVTDINFDIYIYNYIYNCNLSNLTLTRDIWLTVFESKYKYIATNKKNRKNLKNSINMAELTEEKQEIYKDLFNDGNTYTDTYDDNNLENSIIESEIMYIDSKIEYIINDTYIICNNIKLYKTILKNLCDINPYRCVAAILGKNNIKVYKERNIYKIKPCTIITDYKFKFEKKNNYNNKTCYYDIPIDYKINNVSYHGYFNTFNGEIFSESYITNNCPESYNIELNNTLYEVSNNTLKKIDTEIKMVLKQQKLKLELPVYKDIIPQINKIKNLPDLQDVKYFESTDEIYSSVILQDETIHEFEPIDVNFNSIGEFFKSMLSSPLKIFILIVIILGIIGIIILLIACIPCFKNLATCGK
ncbi:unknown similar to AMEV045 [Mythimna separata entomopoxvirus 'L']|uniref:Uncharacterized protein n=1 Tax=Mythimna separata entomopoxvirus 'L' TaxID=1293572 RepID=A0A916KQ45_9POXV|nr:unknown similar to AMEV045 [Mythimna separata entomopoxvirus 'L']CCU56269.1 unknown similar to AMEV045 [Mythimna separata entomopoxvirus 'L']